MGAEWFESTLIDYDPASNYGNWSYNSGVGTDPRLVHVVGRKPPRLAYGVVGSRLGRKLPAKLLESPAAPGCQLEFAVGNGEGLSGAKATDDSVGLLLGPPEVALQPGDGQLSCRLRAPLMMSYVS